MKYCPATGGRPESWKIRQGNYITLGELFVFGAHRCSCWDLYRIYIRPWIFSSARRSTPCRARRRPSACRTPRGASISRQASGVSRSDPRAIHACSVTQESPCHPTESRGVELCRNPATGGESSCHHLATRLVGTVCCRTSSAPNKKMKCLDALVVIPLLLLNCHSGSSSSPPPSPSACHLASKQFFVRRCLGASQLAPAPLQRF